MCLSPLCYFQVSGGHGSERQRTDSLVEATDLAAISCVEECNVRYFLGLMNKRHGTQDTLLSLGGLDGSEPT